MKKFFIILGLILLLTSWQHNTVILSNEENNSEYIESSECEASLASNSDATNDSQTRNQELSHLINTEQDYSSLFTDNVTLDFIVSNTITADKVRPLYDLNIYWIDTQKAFAIDKSDDTLNVFVVDVYELSVSRYETTISTKEIRDIRIVDDKLLVSSTVGFRLIDLDGMNENVFLFEDEQDTYGFPLETLSAKFSEHPPIISNDLRYIAYYQFHLNESVEGFLTPGGWWEIVLLDRYNGTQNILMHEEWSDSTNGDGVLSRTPIAFSKDNSYLFFNYTQLAGMSGDYFGGRINIDTKTIDISDEVGSFQLEKIIDDNSVVVFRQTPPLWEIDNICSFDFQINSFTEYYQVNLDKLDRTSSLHFFIGDGVSVLNYNTKEFSVLCNQNDSPDFNFQDISEDGKLIGMAIDMNGDYVFTVLDLSTKE